MLMLVYLLVVLGSDQSFVNEQLRHKVRVPLNHEMETNKKEMTTVMVKAVLFSKK